MLAKLVNLLPKKLQPYAKALVPLATTVVGVGAHWIITGDFNATEIKVAIDGAVTGLLVLLIPNVNPAAE